MRLPRLLAGILVGLFALAPAALAAGDVPTRIPDQAVYDLSGAVSPSSEHQAEVLLASLREAFDTDVVVVVESVPAGTSAQAATARATVLRVGLEVGRGTGDDGLLLYLGVAPGGCSASVVWSPTEGLSRDVLRQLAAQGVVDHDMQPLIAACDLDSALLVGLGRLATDLAPKAGGGGSVAGEGDGTPAGPPFPDPLDGVRVYDHAGAFRADTIATVAKTIGAIEARTGAEVVVYSQVVEEGRTTEEADGDARALMDQWHVGRKGFDDGLVILFDLYPGLDHGQVILYGGPGYRAAYLDNSEKQRIFDDDMLPRLKAGDMDGALLVAIGRVDDNATPEHAASLQRARQIDAVIGLVGAPVLAALLVGRALWSWLRFGRDPVYLDDPSIHMAGPPADLTPAGAVVILESKASRRALTTAMLDLASRGEIAFREESHLLGLKKTVGIVTEPPPPDPGTLARQRLHAARTLGSAEQIVAGKLRALGLGSDGFIEAKRLPEFAPSVPAFDEALERDVVANGWFREAPSKVTTRYRIYAGLELVLGIAGIVAGANLPSNGLLLIGMALVGAGIVSWLISGAMPAVTLPGAMIRAMLAAYRRTLKKTMDQARSMDQVVAESGLDWLETPDQAVVWGMALGLQHEVESVLARSLDDQRAGRTAVGSTWLPTWYASPSGLSGANLGDFAGASAGSGGLFSSGGLPDFGGMMSALGTIGTSASTSASSGGGFGGGGSGGGGGGSGGGF